MAKYVYNEDGEIIGQYPEENKPSRLKGIVGSMGNEIRGFHQMMLRKRDEASRRNEMINKMNRKYSKKPIPIDYNVLHAHQKVRIGW